MGFAIALHASRVWFHWFNVINIQHMVSDKWSAIILKVIGSIFRSFINNYIYIWKFNFCTNKMRLDKVTWYIQSLSGCFLKNFTTVTIIFHSTTPVKSTSPDVTGSWQCKQTIIFVHLLIHTYIFKRLHYLFLWSLFVYKTSFCHTKFLK